MTGDDDDKPTVILDLNALKKQKLKQEEDLANIAQELEFNVGVDENTSTKVMSPVEPSTPTISRPSMPVPSESSQPKATPKAPQAGATKETFPVILFDFNSDAFQTEQKKFPAGFKYHIVKTLPDLNKFLVLKSFQVIVFNYDVNPKAVNSLTAQIKQKFPFTKTLIMAKAISPEKAKIHAQTASGADGYSQFPVDTKKIEAELIKIRNSVKKVS